MHVPAGNIAPPDIEWILDKLGFTNARHTIPKVLHEGLMQPLEHIMGTWTQDGKVEHVLCTC